MTPSSAQPEIPAPAHPPREASPASAVESTAGLQTLFERESPSERRTPRGYTALLGLATVGICIAVITPVMASMTYKL